MNRSVTSKEQLLSAAREMAYTNGLNSVNIRAVAARCGVAVGSIYNYYPTKADLIAAVIEDFWRQATHRDRCVPRLEEPFPDYVARLYEELRRELNDFQTGWLEQISTLNEEIRKKGRALEAKCFAHIKEAMVHALDQDVRVSEDSPAKNREAFIEFVFHNLMLLLRSEQVSCQYFQQILARVLYR